MARCLTFSLDFSEGKFMHVVRRKPLTLFSFWMLAVNNQQTTKTKPFLTVIAAEHGTGAVRVLRGKDSVLSMNQSFPQEPPMNYTTTRLATLFLTCAAMKTMSKWALVLCSFLTAAAMPLTAAGPQGTAGSVYRKTLRSTALILSTKGQGSSGPRPIPLRPFCRCLR
jgi:hypothetical protein